MSKYGHVNSRDFPHHKARPSGAVVAYEGSSFWPGQASRGYNSFEQDAMPKINKIEDEFEAKLDKLQKARATKNLAVMKAYLKKYQLRNHKVIIVSGMGSTFLMLEDVRTSKRTHVSDLSARSGVIDALQELDQFLEGTSDWSYHLDEERLN